MRSGILEKNLFLLFSFLLLLLSCEKTTDNLPTDPVPIDLTTTQVSLVDSGNSFAFDIFRKILDNTAEDKNIIISPMSISYALSMAVNGANNSTRDSILKAMRVNGITMDDLNKSYRDLTSALLSVDERVKISIANSVWTEKEFNPKQQFIDILTSYYSAEARSFDVKDPSAPDEINAWIEDKTNGLIKDMVGQLDPLTVMLLINAVYFKGMWKYQFEESDTHPREFTLADGSGINVPSMSQSTDLKVYSGDGFVMVELPYGQGNFVMDIILPGENSMETVKGLLDDNNYKTWVNDLHETGVDLFLPKFKYGYKSELKEILAAMGMGIAFSDFADFTNIADTALQISSVLHQAFIETNEEGTEAAAATVVVITTTSMGPGSPLVIDINRPFLYILRETSTNTILFMGRVTDPLAE